MSDIRKVINAVDSLVKATSTNLSQSERTSRELRRELDDIRRRLDRVEKIYRNAAEPLPAAWERIITHDGSARLQ